MLRYAHLKDRPCDFVAATGLTLAEFTRLLPAFEAAYEDLYPHHLTAAGTVRHRQAGGGAKGELAGWEAKLLVILVYQQTHPLQTMQALHCGLSQPQANYWLHRLLPVVQRALQTLGMRPERDASQVATSPLRWKAMCWRWSLMEPNGAGNDRRTRLGNGSITVARRRPTRTRRSCW